MATPMTKKEFREDWEELFRQFHSFELTALMMLYRELCESGRWETLVAKATDYVYTTNLEEDPQLH
jgi:hypothetical protein